MWRLLIAIAVGNILNYSQARAQAPASPPFTEPQILGATKDILAELKDILAELRSHGVSQAPAAEVRRPPSDVGQILAETKSILAELKSQGASNSQQLTSMLGELRKIETELTATKRPPLYLINLTLPFYTGGVPGTSPSPPSLTRTDDPGVFACTGPSFGTPVDCQSTGRALCTKYGYSKFDILRQHVAFGDSYILSLVCYD
jgi:hypothetical protein